MPDLLGEPPLPPGGLREEAPRDRPGVGAAGRVSRHTFMTRTGLPVDLLEPDPSSFKVADIAHALAVSNRFVGHTEVPYSVAQHSVLVSYACDPEDAREGLFHDGAEFVTGDLSRAMKRLPELEPAWEPIESRIHRAMCRALGIREAIPPSVKRADDVLAVTEMRDLFDPPRKPALVRAGILPLVDTIRPWPWQEAELRFLRRFLDLFPPERK